MSVTNIRRRTTSTSSFRPAPIGPGFSEVGRVGDVQAVALPPLSGTTNRHQKRKRCRCSQQSLGEEAVRGAVRNVKREGFSEAFRASFGGIEAGISDLGLRFGWFSGSAARSGLEFWGSVSVLAWSAVPATGC